jgi:hypothetical protein
MAAAPFMAPGFLSNFFRIFQAVEPSGDGSALRSLKRVDCSFHQIALPFPCTLGDTARVK